MVAVTGRDASIVALFSYLLLLCAFPAYVGRMTSMAVWSAAGVAGWSWGFTVSGRLRTRDPVEDNVRVVRHQSFVIWTLCCGTAVVGTMEAMVASYVRPWWLQIMANAGFTFLAFVVGCGIFGHSHEWVLRDPNLEKPLFLLDVCVVS
ncbi:unnamed protein product [Ectocarpus sp. CCAP 1310/34]|nr:unnamed protein product [Ectocarpus sp. CCAP 1310/34]